MSYFDERILAKFDEVELEREQMHKYQTEIALPFLKANPFSALFVDMGLGKSVITATLIADLLMELAGDDKTLVIGPLRVMVDTWPTEFKKWRHLAPFNTTLIREEDDDPRVLEGARKDRQIAQERAWDRDVLVAKGVPEAEIQKLLGATHQTQARQQIRADLARSSTSVHFINREQVEWLVNFWGPKWPYRTVIIDESSSFKDHKTERFKALAKVRRYPGLITRLHELTATPAAETYEHLFAQIYLLDLGKRLGKNITHYRNEFFVANKWTHEYTLRPNAEEAILDRIKDICLVMKAEDYLKVDKPTIVPHRIHLPRSVMDLYETMKRDFVVKLPSGAEVEADNAAALCGKLQQIASGVLYETLELLDWDTQDVRRVKKVHSIHDEKVTALREIVESLQGRPVVVVYHLKSTLDRLRKAFPKAVVMDADGKCVKPWNAGKVPMLLIHPQSAAHGLNLQYGGHHMVFFDIPWSLEQYLQAIGRLARQGQIHPVVVTVLMAVGTVDELIFSALAMKEDVQQRLFTTLRRLIKEMLGAVGSKVGSGATKGELVTDR